MVVQYAVPVLLHHRLHQARLAHRQMPLLAAVLAVLLAVVASLQKAFVLVGEDVSAVLVAVRLPLQRLIFYVGVFLLLLTSDVVVLSEQSHGL